jgi:hypothetical protein
MNTTYIILIIVVVCLICLSSAAFIFYKKKNEKEILIYNNNIDDYNTNYNLNYENGKLYYQNDFKNMHKSMAKVLTNSKTKTITVNNTDIKIYVSTIEYEIINYGKNKIKESLIIQIETSPIPLYKNEKSFSNICSQLEDLGFNLHMFNKINTRCFKPMTLQNSIYSGINHLFQLDCVFIKNLKLATNYEQSCLHLDPGVDLDNLLRNKSGSRLKMSVGEIKAKNSIRHCSNLINHDY